MTKEYWIFGYGSLIFKPPPHFDLRVPGYVKGYVRRFWQSSNDHRGTPEFPGRVVTLIDKQYWSTLEDIHACDKDDITWGVAFRIKAEKAEEVRANLDFREKNGYSVAEVPLAVSRVGAVDANFRPLSATQLDAIPDYITCSVYIGTPDNEAFVGFQEPAFLAQRIFDCRGPSGENREYLFKLAEALKRVAPQSTDSHIEDLVERVLELEARDRDTVTPGDEPKTPIDFATDPTSIDTKNLKLLLSDPEFNRLAADGTSVLS